MSSVVPVAAWVRVGRKNADAERDGVRRRDAPTRVRRVERRDIARVAERETGIVDRYYSSIWLGRYMYVLVVCTGMFEFVLEGPVLDCGGFVCSMPRAGGRRWMYLYVWRLSRVRVLIYISRWSNVKLRLSIDPASHNVMLGPDGRP